MVSGRPVNKPSSTNESTVRRAPAGSARPPRGKEMRPDAAFIAVISSVMTVPTINESTIVETIVNTGVFGLSLNSNAKFCAHETTGRTNTRIVLTGNAIAKPEKNIPQVKNPFRTQPR